MSWLSNLFGNKKKTEKLLKRLAHSRGFTQEIVGEHSYQASIIKIVGQKSEKSANIEVTATLYCENDNEFDPMAVAVSVSNLKVGYLSREDARRYRNDLSKIDVHLPDCEVKAKIVGGWKESDSEGDFGIKLNVKWPIALAKSE